MTQLIVSFSPAFDDLARNEIRRHSGRPSLLLAPGVVHAEFTCAYPELMARWRQRPPVYLQHCFPVLRELPTPATYHELQDLLQREVQHRRIRSRLTGRTSFTVQARLFGTLPGTAFLELEAELEHLLHHCSDSPADARFPERVVSVAANCECVFLGVSRASDNLSRWAGGAFWFPVDPNRRNRAELKLMEAIAAFHLHLRPDARALDLGAAPGGWTRILRQHRQQVTAVDPHRFDQDLLRDSGIAHVQQRAEDFLDTCNDSFSVVTNDMVLDPSESARIMNRAAAVLVAEGVAIMTVKLYHEHRLDVLHRCLRALRPVWRICRVKQLHSNRSEVTLFLKPRRTRGQASGEI